MEKKELLSTLDFVKARCEEIGAMQLSYFRGKFNVRSKLEACDLVTEVDERSEKMIVEALRKKFPDHNILCEESGVHEVSQSPYRWVIDPLDGTSNFAQGLPIFAISIALTFKGKSILGVVFAPYIKELYTAVAGQGAFCNGLPIKVGSKSNLDDAILATGFPYDKATHSKNNIREFAAITPISRGLRRMGAAAYDLCCVAAGYLDGYWELSLKPWDIAAGTLIVEEAGGQILPWLSDRPEAIVAANKVLAPKILKAIE